MSMASNSIGLINEANLLLHYKNDGERPGERHEKNPNKEMKNYNSKKEDLEEEDQRQDERNVIL